MRRLACQTLTAEAFAPFGSVIDTDGVPPDIINDGSTRRYSDLAALDLRGPGRDPVISIYVARARTFPLVISKLEQHRQASQLFMPLGLQRFMIVVAPGERNPDWDGVSAFLTAPGQGVSLKRGCWHHGLIALADGDRFAVVEGGNYRLDTIEVAAAERIELFAPIAD